MKSTQAPQTARVCETPGGVTVSKYGNRNWAVYYGENLLAVTVYKRGARAVADLVQTLTQQHATLQVLRDAA